MTELFRKSVTPMHRKESETSMAMPYQHLSIGFFSLEDHWSELFLKIQIYPRRDRLELLCQNAYLWWL